MRVTGSDPRDGRAGDPPVALWHVVLTLGGSGVGTGEVRASLERLRAERPFLLSCRYAGDRAELRYWEQAHDAGDVAALALRLWGEHQRSARLPAWQVCGLEVLDRETYQRRAAARGRAPALVPAGGVHPF